MQQPDLGADLLGTHRRARLSEARLYLVCDSSPGGRDLAHVLAAAVAGGVDVVQLRDKRLAEDELLRHAEIAGAVCRERGALFIVNDRPDIAVRAGADGVHIGQDDMPVARAREIVGPEMLVGLSTHAPSEIDAAILAIAAGSGASHGGALHGDALHGDALHGGALHGGALHGSALHGSALHGGALSATPHTGAPQVDYIGVGPVHATPTKPGRAAVGTELVSYARAHASVPFFAIGGIDAENIAAVVDAGARRVCVLRAIADAEDPEHAALTLRAALDRVAPGDSNGRG